MPHTSNTSISTTATSNIIPFVKPAKDHTDLHDDPACKALIDNIIDQFNDMSVQEEGLTSHQLLYVLSSVVGLAISSLEDDEQKEKMLSAVVGAVMIDLGIGFRIQSPDQLNQVLKECGLV